MEKKMKIGILIIVVVGIVYFSLCGSISKKQKEIVKKQSDRIVQIENLLK